MNLLGSKYIIDGVPQDSTPERLLSSVCPSAPDTAGECGTIIDESVDPALETHTWDASAVPDYLALVATGATPLSLPFASHRTRSVIASALIDALWKDGHFRLGNLSLRLDWRWNGAAVGSQAAFYESARAASEYVDGLGITLDGFSCSDGDTASVAASAQLSGRNGAEDDCFETEFVGTPELCGTRTLPGTFVPDGSSWVVYIPFDTSDYRLGGSLLAWRLGKGGGVCPQIDDPDYFIDCYEVVRELVEDGVVIAASTVGDGGLAAALGRMCSGGTGLSADLSDLRHSSGEDNIVRLLFAELPGAVIQIRDSDFDYLDAELLLQDVAFFPLGHPSVGNGRLSFTAPDRSGIQTILESLMLNAEGED